MKGRSGSDVPHGMTRRELCWGAGGAAVLVALGGLRALPASAQVRPPGGQDENRLLSRCVRCGRCVEACPWRVARFSRLEEGVLAARMPALDFADAWCDFCSDAGGEPLCARACPTGALARSGDAAPTLGLAVISPGKCLAWARYNGCRYCQLACPDEYSAIELDDMNRPVVVAGRCVGCGACQAACKGLGESGEPELGVKAIVVEPLQGGVS